MMSILLLFIPLAQSHENAGITSLIRKLRAESIEVRQQAVYRLISIGEPYRRELLLAADSGDSEVVARGRDVLVAIFPHEREVVDEISHPLGHVTRSLRLGSFDCAHEFCEAALLVDPGYPTAIDLKKEVQTPQKTREKPVARIARAERWERQLDRAAPYLPNLGGLEEYLWVGVF